MKLYSMMACSLKLDFQLIFEVKDLSFPGMLSFIIKKYALFVWNSIFGLKNINTANVFGIPYYYNDIFGLASLQRVYCASHKLKQFLPDNPVIVDVGANIGQFHFFCRHYLKAERIISIEPLSDCYEILKLNSTIPSDCLNYLVSNDTAERYFYIASESSQLSTCLRAGNTSYVDCILLPGKKLDDIIGGCGFQRIDLLKIDIEGSEYDALLSAEHTLTNVGFVLVEMSVMRKCAGNLFRTGSYLNDHHFELVSLGSMTEDRPEDVDGFFKKI